MFYYYGRKKKIARLYPTPAYPTIVEPFAGSAAYSLHGNNWKRNVILVEKDPKVAALWKWFIQEATEDDILNLPDPTVGEHTDNFLHILHAASKRAFEYKKYKATQFLLSAWRASKPYMAANVHKVKHWTLIEGDYSSAPNVEDTWFIDPPYQGDPGMGYRCSSASLNYAALADWVHNRKGEVIVCDQPSANWLPFEPLTVQSAAAGKKNSEGLYYSSPHKQIGVLELFSEPE